MPPYTCKEYRQEMRLLGLKNRLSDPGLDQSEKELITKEIKKLEAEMDMN
jgi:hypothetical protein